MRHSRQQTKEDVLSHSQEEFGPFSKMSLGAGQKELSAGDINSMIAELRAEGRLNAPIHRGLSALQWACLQGLPLFVAALLAAGAAPNGSPQDGGWCRSPLGMSFSSEAWQACADLLLTAGAELDFMDSEKMAPIHYAVFFQRGQEPLRWLLAKGADPSLAATSGPRPLHVAVATSNVEAAKILMAAGADPRALTTSDSLALEGSAPQPLNALDLAKGVRPGPSANELIELLTNAIEALNEREALDASACRAEAGAVLRPMRI